MTVGRSRPAALAALRAASSSAVASRVTARFAEELRRSFSS